MQLNYRERDREFAGKESTWKCTGNFLYAFGLVLPQQPRLRPHCVISIATPGSLHYKQADICEL